jgi:hypothetical protein
VLIRLATPVGLDCVASLKVQLWLCTTTDVLGLPFSYTGWFYFDRKFYSIQLQPQF